MFSISNIAYPLPLLISVYKSICLFLLKINFLPSRLLKSSSGSLTLPTVINELNSDALETNLINRDQEYPHLRKKYNSSDIKKVVLEENYFENLLDSFKKDFKRDFREDSVDLVAGGPPCQGFSLTGTRNENDERYGFCCQSSQS